MNNRFRTDETWTVLALLVLFWTLAFVAMCTGPVDAAEPKHLLIANVGGYSTTVLASNSSASSASWTLTEPGCFALPARTIAAKGAAVQKTAGNFCSQLALVDSSVSAVSIIHFADGKSESSFIVPAIGAITVDAPANFLGPVMNDSDTGSYLTFLASEKSAVTITLYDGARNQIATETYDVPKGASQFRPQTKFAVGFLSVALGYTQFGLTPSKAPLYGFVSVATPSNGNSIIYPFGQ